MTRDLTAAEADLKERIQTLAKQGTVKVVFRKKDGTLRTLLGTLHPSCLPPPKDPADRKRAHTPNPAMVVIFDVEAEGWRSFHPEQLVEGPEFIESPL